MMLPVSATKPTRSSVPPRSMPIACFISRNVLHSYRRFVEPSVYIIFRGVSMIVMMAGLPGSGKSTVARAIAQRLPGTVLDKDVIRAALFDPARIEYSQEQDDFCQEIMLQTAA